MLILIATVESQDRPLHFRSRQLRKKVINLNIKRENFFPLSRDNFTTLQPQVRLSNRGMVKTYVSSKVRDYIFKDTTFVIEHFLNDDFIMKKAVID